MLEPGKNITIGNRK